MTPRPIGRISTEQPRWQRRLEGSFPQEPEPPQEPDIAQQPDAEPWLRIAARCLPRESIARPGLTPVLESYVAGLRYHLDPAVPENAALLASFLPGTELRLQRAPEDKFDPLAVLVLTPDGRRLGYIARSGNEVIARMMDAGREFAVFVAETAENQKTASTPACRSRSICGGERRRKPKNLWEERIWNRKPPRRRTISRSCCCAT